ncbi:MAG: PilT/PilU family type 4a pilus ATPase [Candidatus Gastranaerophilales bacterium]|nr:PilT/PilU family type 4a pilus ATPase [Candidatus Gastranaerophilales bacterium]
MAKFDIIRFLKEAVEKGASDIHLRTDEPPALRKDSKIFKTNLEPLSESDMFAIIDTLLPVSIKNKAFEVFDLDFAYEIKGVSRFRVNLSRELGRMSMVIRVISYEILSFDELNLPKSIENFSHLTNGIVLITGPTGSGKSTTIASLLDYINEHYQKHIITIEDPVEYIYTDKKSIFTQRQIEIDTASFPDGVKYALRQDPDVILIGEIRDRETMQSALKASETGHLVFATLHTNDAVQTVNRIVNFFDPQDRDFVRKQLAETLKGTVAQKLLPKKDAKGRVPACEVLVVTPTVKDFIIKDEVDKIYELVKKGSFNDMITLNMSLFSMISNGVITREDGLYASDNQNELEQYLRGAFHGTNFNPRSNL